MTTHLCEILPVLNRDHQQETRLLTVFWSNAPTSRHTQRKVEDVETTGRVNSQHCILDVAAFFEI